jgi:hypothetical protein
VKLPNLHTALVIAGDSGLRKCIVQKLRHEGWIVHGITKAEHALPILAHIPYQLIIVGLAHLGAFSASREDWSDDLAHFLGQLAIENG